MGGSVPEKEKQGSKPVALCGHAGSPSRQASTEDILPELALDTTQGSSEQRFTEEEAEWSLQGGYGYFVTKTVAPTLYILSLAMVGAGAVAALTFISWVVKTLF